MFRQLCAWAAIVAIGGGLADGAHAQDRSGVRPEVLDHPDGPGSVEGWGGSLEPSPNTGASRYAIPIEVPPGVAGLEPQLALSYASGQGNRAAGLGWDLTVPSIHRDVTVGLPRYGDEDVFALRGMASGHGRLAEVADGSYRLEVEGAFLRAVHHADDTWTVTDRSGVAYHFGESAPARTEDAGRVFAWQLTRIEDLHGNGIRFGYTRNPSEEPCLEEVVYNDFSETARNAVRISWESRPDPLTSFVATFPVSRTDRVAAIAVTQGGEPVRTYQLNYATNEGLSVLTSVDHVGADGLTTLPPYQFAYAQLVTDVAEVVPMTAGTTRALGQDTELTDVDGDGLTDVVVMSATADGGQYSWYRNIDGVQWADRQLLAESPSVWLSSSDVQLADLDGDAAADVVARITSGSTGVRWYRSRSAEGFAASGQIVTTELDFSPGDPNVRMVDLDHDRRTDWMRINPATGRVTVALNEGDGVFSAATTMPDIDPDEQLTFGTENPLRLADMNGDGLTDLVTVRRGRLRYFPSQGFGTFGGAVSMEGAPTLEDNELAAVQIRDLTGDGLADLVLVGASEVRVWCNLGGDRWAAPVVVDDTPFQSASSVVRLADMNGNGTADIVWFDPSADAPWQYLDLLLEGGPGLLTRIDNGLGHVMELSYAGLATMQAWAESEGIAWTYRSPMGQMLLHRVVSRTGLHPDQVTDHFYAGGYFDPEYREFAGFEQSLIVEYGDDRQPTRETWSTFDVGDVDRAARGNLRERSQYDADGTLFLEEQLGYDVVTLATSVLGDPVRYSYVSEQAWVHHEGTTAPVVVRALREEDAYGNETRLTELGRDDQDGDERITVRTFAINVDRWIVDRLATEEVTTLDGVRRSAGRTYYDGAALEGLALGEVERGDAMRGETWIEGDTWARQFAREYDEYGNVVVQVDARGSRREVEFDEVSHTFPVTERREVEAGRFLTWSVEVDRRHGGATRATDPNNLVSVFEYDPLHRLIAFYEPDAVGDRPSRQITYELGAPRSTVTDAVTLDADTTSLSQTVYDGRGRALWTASQRSGDAWVVSDWTTYGARGWAEQIAYPFDQTGAVGPDSAPSGELTTSYDAMGRTIREVEADGAERWMEYLPLAQVKWDENDTDAASPHQGTVTEERTDGLGRLIAVEETVEGGSVTTTYAYDVLDNVVGWTDARRLARTFTYDGLSRRVALDDPNAGAWSFTYSDAGDLLERVDADGNVVSYVYDLVGRPLEEHHALASGTAEPVTRYHYDQTQVPDDPRFDHVVGRLAWVEDAAGEVAFSYDVRGRQVRTLRTWEDGTTDGLWTEFDQGDRPVVKGFPDGSSVRHTFDQLGRMLRAGDLIQDVQWTAWSSVASADLGNGTTLERTYDDRQRVVQHALQGAEPLFDLRYTLDGTGRLLEQVDAQPSAHAFDHSVQVTYDDRYRLIEEVRPGQTNTYRYDDGGNLLQRTSSGARALRGFTIPEGPDDLVRIVDWDDAEETIRYDQAGRTLQDGERTLTWDARGRLARVETAEGSEAYVYDYDHRRAIKRVTRDGEVQTVRYLGPSVERRNGELVRYVMMEGQRTVRLAGSLEPRAGCGCQVPLGRASWGLLAWVVAGFTALVWWRRGGAAWGLVVWLLAAFPVACQGPTPEEGSLPWDQAWAIEGVPERAEFLFHDRVGHVLATVDAEGAVASEARFTAYGEEERSGQAEVYGFAGNERDEVADLGAFGARALRHDLGRFLSPDPVTLLDPTPALRHPAMLTPYAFSAGDPMNYTDPSGELPFLAVVAVAVVVFEVASSAYDAYSVGSAGVELYQDPSWSNAGNLAYEVGMAGIGLVAPGGGYSAADDIVEAGARGLRSATDDAAGVTSNVVENAGRCFVAGTEVMTPDGAVPIEALAVGDEVLAASADGEVVATVLNTFVRVAPAVVEAELRYADGTIDVITATPDHPFWVGAVGDYVPLQDLRAGAELHVQGGGTALLVSQTWHQGDAQVFDVEIAGVHSFFVRGSGSAVAGILVHNSGPVRPGDVGSYGDLKSQKRRSGETEALDMDHQPSFAAQRLRKEQELGRPLTPEELRALRRDSPAVASPREVHQQTSPTYGGRNTPDRIEADAADLDAAAARDRAAFDEAMNNRD